MEILPLIFVNNVVLNVPNAMVQVSRIVLLVKMANFYIIVNVKVVQ